MVPLHSASREKQGDRMCPQPPSLHGSLIAQAAPFYVRFHSSQVLAFASSFVGKSRSLPLRGDFDLHALGSPTAGAQHSTAEA